MIALLRPAILASCLMLPAACGQVPSGAPIEAEVLGEAQGVAADFALYPVTRAFLPAYEGWPRTGEVRSSGWPARGAGREGARIATGDTVQILVWDNEENSLIVPAGQRVADIGPMEVSARGEVFLPYLGRVGVAGLSETDAQDLLQARLETLSPTAQVQMTVAPGRSGRVDVIGGVGSPGSIELGSEPLSVLSAIAEAGGVSATLENPQVRLLRGGATYVRRLSELVADPAQDPFLRGGDKLFVEEDPRSFVAFGAAREETVIPFDRERITAIEALAMMGGLTDNRGNLQGILILRQYPASAVGAPGVSGPTHQRVIFSINLASADGLFSAGRFQINPGDLVLATESPIARTRDVIAVMGSLVGLGTTVQNLQ